MHASFVVACRPRFSPICAAESPASVRGSPDAALAALAEDRRAAKEAAMSVDVATTVAGRPPVVAPSSPLILLEGVEKTYRMGRVDYRALRGVDLTIEAGEMVAVVGPSGSGKTTILNMVTGIDRPTAGSVVVDGQRIDALGEEELAVWRGANVGIVFQFFQLLPTLSALENAVLPLDFARRGSKRERYEQARHNLELVGLGDKGDHLPAELSGGEQQRVAIARSLAADPRLIVGDEPTGNLDTVTAGEMFELFSRLNAEGKTVLYVTHDVELAARAHRVVTIRDGLVVGG
jgi:putative ABC transport system ATP-binding protein